MKIAASTIITCHNNADWDALSSVLGLSFLYPDATLIFPGSLDKPLVHFFNDGLENLFQFKPAKEIDPQSVRLIVIADTRQRSRLGHIEAFLKSPGVEVHAWDHHPDPEPEDSIPIKFFRVAQTGSTCTLVCQALQAKGVKITCEIATLLGLGIYGDTGAFTYTSTTPADYQAAAWLRQRGMDLPSIADQIQHDMTSAHVKVLNDLIDFATVHAVGIYKVIVTEARSENFLEDFAYLAQKFMEMEPCDVLFALGNMDEKVQLVARSRVNAIDVGEICRQLGGGGHSFAASASVKGMPVPELKDALFRLIFSQVHPDKRACDLMSSPAVGIEESQTIRQAETTMNRYGLKAAPVFRTGTHQCCGYMECQTASRAVIHGLGDMVVSIYMQRNVLTVHPNDSLQRLIEIIVGAHQRMIPVVDKNEVVGVVTRTDVINMFVEDPGRIPVPKNNKKERNLLKLLNTRIPKEILRLLRLAGDLGDRLKINVFAIGGLVRDISLSRPANEFDDVDLVVEGNGIAFGKALAKELGGRIREHRTFMTALIIYKDPNGHEQRLDVATARLEYYQYPAALPTVELSSIKMDLFRRDFTINAMAIRLNKNVFGDLVDFFGGQTDIQKKTIRVIHSLSFVEDPTRIIRAVRFEQRYGFHISVQGEKLIKNALSLNLIKKLSGSRIRHEMGLIFNEVDPPTCLIRLDNLGVLPAIHESLTLTPDRISLLTSIRDIVDWYNLLYLKETLEPSILYILALCSGLSTETTTEILKRMDISQNQLDEILMLRQHIWKTGNTLTAWEKERKKTGKMQVSHLCEILLNISLEGLLYVMARTPEENIRSSVSQYIYKWRKIKSDITGEDIKAIGLPAGPAYSIIMRKILAAKLDGIAVTRDAQLQLAQQLVSETPGWQDEGKILTC